MHGDKVSMLAHTYRIDSNCHDKAIDSAKARFESALISMQQMSMEVG